MCLIAPARAHLLTSLHLILLHIPASKKIQSVVSWFSSLLMCLLYASGSQLPANLYNAGDGANFTVLALPGRFFVKVDAKATPSKFLIAASAGHCNAAMAAVLGIMVSAGGLASTPIALIASHSQVNDWPCLASYHLLQMLNLLLCSAW